MTDSVRIEAIFRTAMEVLRDSVEPLSKQQVVDAVAGRFDFTPYEAHLDERGRPRWQVALGWRSGDAATIGWIIKRGHWFLTEAGIEALATYSESELFAELLRRYQEIRRHRTHALKQLSGSEQLLVEALGSVPAGAWTSYRDLAEATGLPEDQLPHFLAQVDVPGAYRVAYDDGTLPGEGMRHFRYRGGDIAQRLRSESVTFDPSGRLSQTDRVQGWEIKERLEELPSLNPEPGNRRAWLVRGSSVDGRDLVPVWLHRGSVSLAASSLREIPSPIERDLLKTAIEEDYQHKSYAVRQAKLAEFDAFCNRMRPGDYVLTTTQGKAYVGRITGEAVYVHSSDQRSNLRRAVAWLNETRPVPFANLPHPLPAKLHSQSDVVELTENLTAVEELLTALGVELDDAQAGPPKDLAFGEVGEELAEETFIDRAQLQRLADLLWENKQIILYGPPGTGKTFLARKLAGRLAEPSAVKLVQFHPSYTYEDFFEGFRPVQRADGQLAFELRPGPFRQLVEAARQHPSDPYILIIDEINRANLAKVFGELYFLLEYRDDAISLLYSAEADFTLPENIFVIGTMNTTDRSIALVDAAMRRRFRFVELHPDLVPVRGLLGRWLERLRESDPSAVHNLDAPALLEALNARIEDHDLAIGPSYLMKPGIYHRVDGLETVWETSILPLLAEHHYGSPPSVLDRYRLSALRQAAAVPK
ncbi:AAA family ATPase [Planomonospora sp. ID82291]|uniref:AAA family ATPase n=1 Tax=Planomonospora sp. ID82291 TaxID=2738136 RepID=UPI0018C3B84C|nr:AAA family ATPase [Planomonospora sp. ID82291]MBG0818400.1 AAA family ATPase [Planomonospora sp. ID82291]